MKQKVLVLYILSLTLNSLMAQKSVDLFQISHKISSSLSETSINALMPIVIDKSNTLVNRLSGQNSEIGEGLNQFELFSGIKHKNSTNWSCTALGIFRYRSVNSRSNIRAFQIGGMFLAEKEYSDSITFNFGTYVNNEKFGLFVVPIIGVNWHISKRWELDAKLPLNAQLSFSLSSKNKVAFYYKGVVSTFYYDNKIPSYLSYNYNELCFLYEFEPIKSFVFQTKIGKLVGASLNEYNREDKVPVTISAIEFGDKRNVFNTKDLNSTFFNISFIYRFYP